MNSIINGILCCLTHRLWHSKKIDICRIIDFVLIAVNISAMSVHPLTS